MTIIASVKVRDGVVLATDSMSQISTRADGAVTVIKTYCNARKLFQIGNLPIGVMSYGIGNIGPRSAENLVLDFGRKLDVNIENKPQTVENIARGLFKYIKKAYDETFQGLSDDLKSQLGMGFYISGHDVGDALFSEEWEFILPTSVDVLRVRNTKECVSKWTRQAAM